MLCWLMYPVISVRCDSFSFSCRWRSENFADSSPDGAAFDAGTVVGFPHFWQSKVIPAAAPSTTKEVEQCAQAKTISGFAVCIRRNFKQETYRTQCGKGFAARARGHASREGEQANSSGSQRGICLVLAFSAPRFLFLQLRARLLERLNLCRKLRF